VRSQSALALAVVGALALTLLGCAGRGPARRTPPPGALRISEIANQGDATRRASLRLVIEGLASDAASSPERALDRYELAIQVDPTNPYAFLALARHHVASGDPASAAPFLDQTLALVNAQGAFEPRLEAHLVGLRGAIDYGNGDLERGMQQLAHARELAPEVWGDGRLSADELR
jgi:tetratricopeptide (TPR) repeat protein